MDSGSVDDRVWYTAQMPAGPGSAVLLGDLAQAWSAAEAADAEATRQGRPALRLGQEVRYALVTATLHSLAQEIPPGVLATLVQTGRWRPDQALAAAQQHPDPEARSQALAALAPHLPDRLRHAALQHALEAARTIEDAQYR